MTNTKNILLLGTSMFLSGIMNYIYQYIMIQELTIESYSEFASLLSLINIIGVLTVACSLFLVKEMSRNITNIGNIINVSRKSLLYIGLFAFLLFILFSPLIQKFLSIENLHIVILAGSSLLFFFISVYQWAFFQATKKTHIYSLWQILTPLIRIIFGFFFVYIGLGLAGAIGGFITSQIILFIIGTIIVKKHSNNLPSGTINSNSILSSFISQKKQILQYLLTSILIALFMNIDILIVKNIFDGETAGYYAAISVLAKFLVFLGLSIETVYYPQLVKETVLPKMQLLKVSVYYAVMTIGALVFFMLFGEIILRLFKDGLQDYIGLVYPLLIYCGLLGYLSIIVKTLIAFEKYTINYLLGALIIGLVICLYSLGNTPVMITQIFAMFGLVGVGLGLSQVWRR